MVRCSTLKKYCTVLEFSNLLKQESGKHVWEGILRMQDMDERNIKMDQAISIDIGSLRGNTEVCIARQLWQLERAITHFVCLVEIWIKRWPRSE